jgi:hypothetical protein
MNATTESTQFQKSKQERKEKIEILCLNKKFSLLQHCLRVFGRSKTNKLTNGTFQSMTLNQHARVVFSFHPKVEPISLLLYFFGFTKVQRKGSLPNFVSHFAPLSCSTCYIILQFLNAGQI